MELKKIFWSAVFACGILFVTLLIFGVVLGSLFPKWDKLSCEGNCVPHSLGEVVFNDEIFINLSEQAVIKNCDSYSRTYHYYVLPITIYNAGNKVKYISLNDFRLIDSKGNAHLSKWSPEGDCSNANTLKNKKVQIGSTIEGELWFMLDAPFLPNGETTIIWNPTYMINDSEIFFIFKVEETITDECPDSCDDFNPCTIDSCSESSNYLCIHSLVDDLQSCGTDKICMEGECISKSEYYISSEQQWKTKATTLRVYAESYNWDADAEDDGIRVNINLLNEDFLGLDYDEPAVFDIQVIEMNPIDKEDEYQILYYGRNIIVDNLQDVSYYSGNPKGKGILIDYAEMNLTDWNVYDWAYLKIKVSVLVNETLKVEGEQIIMLTEAEVHG